MFTINHIKNTYRFFVCVFLYIKDFIMKINKKKIVEIILY